MESSSPQQLTIEQAIDRAVQLYRAGEPGQANEICRQIVAKFPHVAAAWQLLGVSAAEHGDLEIAIRYMEQALQLEGARPDFLSNLGEAYRRAGDLTKAQAALEKAIQLNPSSAFAMGNLGVVFRELGEARQARQAFLRAGALQPLNGWRVRATTVLPIILESSEQIVQERARLFQEIDELLASDLRLDNPVSQIGMVLFYSAYHGLEDRELHERMARLFLRAAPSLSYVAPHCSAAGSEPFGLASQDRPIRIGFLSQFFFEHTIARLTAGLLRNFSREQFDVTLFCLSNRRDSWSQFLRQCADRTIVLPLDIKQIREQIAACELDVLVYPDIGMDPKTYFLAFSRLAPVQCVSWGHPVTTGIPTIDYFISSAALEPPDAARQYSEQLVLLDNLPTFYYRPACPQPCRSRAALGLPGDSHLYVCPHSLFKMHPEFDAVLRDILIRDPAGQLVLVDSWEPHWKHLLNNRLRQTLGAEFGRVVLLPRMSAPAFLELLAVADVILDPLHFSGGNTSYEAFSVGTPIVTLPGRLMRSRVTAAIYRQLGIDDCIASDTEHYVQLALRLGTDRAWRSEIRQRLIEAAPRIYENLEAVRELERFFVQAVRRQGHRRA